MPKRLSHLCYGLAAYGFLVVLMAAMGADTLLTAPGSFLFSRFHMAALYFPGILFIGGWLLASGRRPRRTMILLWLSPVLFLTSAVFLQTAVGNEGVLAARMILEAFGRIPAALLLGLLLGAEIVGMAKLSAVFTDPDDRLMSLAEFRRRWTEVLSFLGLTDEVPETEAAGSEEPTVEDRPSMAFPSFPDPPEPIVEPELDRDRTSTDPEVADLIRRTLEPTPAMPSREAAPDEAPKTAGVPNSAEYAKPAKTPDLSAVFQSIRHPEPEAPPLDPAFAFLAGEDEISDQGDGRDDGEDEEPPVGLEAADDPSDLSDLGYGDAAEPADISAKLDPHRTGPVGVVAGKKPRSRRRRKYEVPVEGLLADYPDAEFDSIDDVTRRGAEVLEQTLKEFKIEARVTGIRKGPVITMYELLPSPGVKISRIVNLQDNIALRLAASRVRIVAPIPGKHAVGIEVPNKKRAIVSFSSLVSSEEFRESDADIPVILGKDISGGNQVIDLTRTPHLLIAGATGSGKSVCVNSLIGSILYARSPRDVNLIMVDPKIVELKLYNDIPHLLTPVITEPKRALQALQWCLSEMERRYALLDSQGVRDIRTYNKRVKDLRLATEPIPYIVVVVDEFADLMATSGKELEAIVARLAAMSRAVGIHLVLATQRPSVDVITGLIKANFPSRIAFMVAGKTDSRIIIDAMGAEKLLGRGDMLFTSAWDPFPSRMQGAFLAEEEVERMTDHVKTLGEPEYIDDEMFVDDEDSDEFQLESVSGDDPMYEKALEIVVNTRKASASYLQRRLKIGYNRAARLVEEMERRGIVGPANGSKPRDLIHVPDRFTASEESGDREPSSA